MDPEPVITPLSTASKTITIKILDTLQPNTTYAFNFGESIEDNNEGKSISVITDMFFQLGQLLILFRLRDWLLKL